jgi:hypothetical protein
MPSTVIRALSYDDVTGTLFVTFVDGDLYAYLGVPRAVFEGFRSARSKGAYFGARVRNAYPCRRMDEGGELLV